MLVLKGRSDFYSPFTFSFYISLFFCDSRYLSLFLSLSISLSLSPSIFIYVCIFTSLFFYESLSQSVCFSVCFSSVSVSLLLPSVPFFPRLPSCSLTLSHIHYQHLSFSLHRTRSPSCALFKRRRFWQIALLLIRITGKVRILEAAEISTWSGLDRRKNHRQLRFDFGSLNRN